MRDFHAPFYLIHRDGSTWEYPTLDDLERAVREAGLVRKIAAQHVVHVEDSLGGGVALHNDWIVRDFYGLAVPSSVFRYRRYIPSWERARAIARRAQELGLPIPGTGCRRAAGRYYRRPRHIGLNRSWAAEELDREECELRHTQLRPCRRREVTTSYSDIMPAADRIRSWKRHRRTQYRAQ